MKNLKRYLQLSALSLTFAGGVSGTTVAITAVVGGASVASCSTAGRALKETGNDWQKKVSDMSKTKISNKYIEVGAIGLAKTYDTAKEIGVLKGKAAAAEILGSLIKVSQGEKVDNSVVADADLEVSTTEIYDAVRTSNAEALLTGAFPTAVEYGTSQDGSGRIMAVVRVRVPLSDSSTRIQ